MSRSKLEPYSEFIRELRSRGRSYQEIVQILRDRCGVTTAFHTVYNFVRVRAKPERKQRAKRTGASRSTEIVTSNRQAETAEAQSRIAASNDAWERIEALKRRPSGQSAGEKVFVYDEDQPLKLVQRGENLDWRLTAKQNR
ncbi:MAG TPA: hypothetical protein VKB79_16690 [Bryobacteraceae bacterium]|nr:hypothetical protein [Bryobacteraceae bacterium]